MLEKGSYPFFVCVSRKRGTTPFRKQHLPSFLICLLCAAGALGSRTPAQTPDDPAPSARALPAVEGTTFSDEPDTLSLKNGDFKLVLDKNWGGAIREIWLGDV